MARDRDFVAPAPGTSWESRYRRQALLIASMTSLLQKYGSTTDIEALQGTFVLTLMGHFVTGEACYYHVDDDGMLRPVLAYGRVAADRLPAFGVDATPAELDVSTHRPAPIAPGASALSGAYRVAAPLRLSDRLVGVLFLGERVSGQAYDVVDMDVLEALCAASAVTFNNALLYRNARMSAQEIRRLYDVRSEVIGRITHEFRTPLTVIRAGIEPLQRDSNYAEMHGWLIHAVDRLEELISDLLRLSAEKSDDAPLAAYDPMPTIEDAIAALAARARERDMVVSVTRRTIEDSASVTIGRGDLGTAIHALVENAIKFGGHGSTIHVDVETWEGAPSLEGGIPLPDWREQTARVAEEYAARPNHRVDVPVAAPYTGARWFLIRVTDTGIGIPSDEIRSVAEPFRQASNSPDVGIRGSGLGLALVQKVVSENGGVVFCRSESNEGATFALFLPAY